MKSSLDSFDYLLNDDILEKSWKQLTGGYRNLLVEQQLQTDFVESLESNQQLSVFLENSFTQFSEEMNLTAIERLTGMIESKANQPQSNMLPERRLQKVDERHSELSETKLKELKLTVKPKPAGQIAASEKANSNAKKEAVKPISKLPQIKTPKQGRDQQGAITPAFARAELNNRAVKLGRGNEWSDKKIENGHFVKTKMTADAEAANSGKVKAGEGNPNQGYKANIPLGTDKKELSRDHKKNVKLKKEQTHISSSKKTIDRLMDEKIEDLQSAKETEPERFVTQRNQTKAASRNNPPVNNASLMNNVSSSASSIARPVSTGNGVGGLRGLAALAKANSEGDKPSQPATSETNQNVTDARVTQKPRLNVVDSNTSSSRPTTVASIAKLLADEARRSGIDLEKFQP